MQSLFIVIYLAGLLFFLLKKRSFDVFSLAYFSCGIYFMPGFFGYVLLPTATVEQISIVAETYLVFIIVCISILIGGAVYRPRRIKPVRGKMNNDRHGIICEALLVTAGIGITYEILRTGNSIFGADKAALLDSETRGLIVFEAATSLAAVAAFAYRKWALLAISVFFLLFDVYIGFRVSLATSVLAICLVFFADREPFRLIRVNVKYILMLLVFGTFVFVYKEIYTSIKLGNWDVVTRALTDPEYYISSLIGSEPFVTQLILNEALIRDFHMAAPTPLDYFAQLIPYLPELGLQQFLQPIFMADMLLPGFDFGLGNNIWAEMIIYGGFIYLIGFVIVFNLVCAFGCHAIYRARSRLSVATAALFFATWAFYIHRNNIGYQITMEKRVLYVFIVAYVCNMLYLQVSASRRSSSSQ
jgi:hypothetical protein